METHPLSLLLLNGKGAGNPFLRDAVKILRNEGYMFHIRVTWEKADTERYINEALCLGVDTIVAGGGDGTINEVATCLAKLEPAKRPVLGFLPLGTANDFATSASIPVEMEHALRLALLGKTTAIDLVQVNGDAFYINMATGGFGARIPTDTPAKLKAALGGVSYFIHGLMCIDTLKPDRCDIRGDGFHWQGDALVIGIGNGRQAGGGRQLCPEALINDGLLELRIFTGEYLLPTLLSTLTHPDDNPNVVKRKSAWFDISAPHDITFNLDGEPLSGKHFHLEIQPATLVCRLPPGCPLLK